LGAFSPLGVEALVLVEAGTGVATGAGAEGVEDFFAIVLVYTLLCEVFLSIFR
jgi:hypothetical protein